MPETLPGPGTGEVSAIGQDGHSPTGSDRSPEILEQLRAAYITLFENTGTATCLIEEDTTISFCNEDFARLVGYTRPEIEGKKSWTEFVAPEELERLLGYHRMRRRDPQGAPRNYEFRFVDRHGRARDIWLTVALIPGTNQSVASFTDITEFKHKEETLRIFQTNYREIFQAVNDAIFVHDAENGQIIDANPRVLTLYGWTPEEVRNLQVEDLSAGVPPYTQAEALEWIKKAAQAPRIFEWLARARNGRLFWVEVNLKRAVIGGRDRLLAVVRDITARKAREARLAAEQERFRVTLASIGDAVICTDCDGRVTFINPVAEQLTGWPAAEALGRPLNEVFNIVNEHTGRPVESPVSRVLSEGTVVGLANHTLLATRYKKLIPITDSGAPIRDAAGEIIGVVLVFRDESERRRAERERLEHSKRLVDTLQQGVMAVARLVEMRDPYTAGHQQRVAELACAIAREMGIEEDRIEALRLAGFLHDIGKITVPAAILNKPGLLNSYEFALVKTHPVTGYEALKDIPFPHPVALTVRQHHERLDGSGYPDGLRGEEILPEARILAVADVLDAMTSHRPYRPAQSFAAALEEITSQSGVLYDPAVVRAALSLCRET